MDFNQIKLYHLSTAFYSYIIVITDYSIVTYLHRSTLCFSQDEKNTESHKNIYFLQNASYNIIINK